MTPRNTRNTKRRRRILGVLAALVLIPTLIWALFGRPSGRADVDCTGGIELYAEESTPLWIGEPLFPVYDVWDIRYVWGEGRAYFGGGYLEGTDVPEVGAGGDLALGESFHHEGVGTFTLTSINPTIFRIPMPGSEGGSVTVCFQPDPDFNLDPKLAERLNRTRSTTNQND